jgi:hypothetical protein
METWKPISGYESFYEVSDHGRVKSLERKIWCGGVDGYYRIISPRFLRISTKSKYSGVGLFKEGRQTKLYVHTLVATHFLGPRPEGYECCHNDGNSHNNRASNLRWDTVSANRKDNWIHGKMDTLKGRLGRPKDWLEWSEEEKAEYNAGCAQRSKSMWDNRTQEERDELAQKMSENNARRKCVRVTFANGTTKTYRSMTEAHLEMGCTLRSIKKIISGEKVGKHTWTARYV